MFENLLFLFDISIERFCWIIEFIRKVGDVAIVVYAAAQCRCGRHVAAAVAQCCFSRPLSLSLVSRCVAGQKNTTDHTDVTYMD